MSFPPSDSNESATPPDPSEEARLLTRPSHDRAVPPSLLATLTARARARLAALQTSSAHRRQVRGLKPHGLHLPRPDGPSRRKTFRRAFAALIALCALAVVAVFLSALWLRHSMRASLPTIDGTLHAAGLTAPVTVTRDSHGVPSIQAANLDDMLFAQGFVTAQDRLWQMDALRRHAAGELAEILGSSLITHDRTQRTLQLRAAAERSIAALPPEQLHQLQAYASGINAFIAQNRDHLSVEFHLLHYTPAPWTPRDSLLVALAMTQDLSTGFPAKLQREALAAHLPVELLPDLYPVGAWRDHPPGQVAPDLTSPKPEIEQIPLDESQSRLDPPAITPGDLLSAQAASFELHCEGCRSGSNNWAVSGARSASGKPLVSNDMHLALSIPDIWYEAALHTSDNALDVAGLTLPGTPLVVVGRNAHVAWSITNLGGDVQDIYIEHTRGSGASAEFQHPDGTWSLIQHHPEHIRVRGGRDIDLDVAATTHTVGSAEISTPVISPLYPSEKRTLALAWTAYEAANPIAPVLAADTAADGAAVASAFSTWLGPSLNIVYADDQGHIGYHAIGRIPIRGPAVRHALAPETAVPVPPAGPPPEDESDDTTSVPSLAPHLVLAGYRPSPRVSTPSRSVPRRSARRAPHPAAKATRAPKPVKQQQRAPKSPPPVALVPAPPAAIAYTIGSPIPAVPVDALDPNAQWSGYVSYNDLPAVVDPPDGLLATANARITPDRYPYALTLNWASPYRVERITRLLAGRTGLTPADMLKTQMDVHSDYDLVLAQRITYALDHAPAGTRNLKRLSQAADILRTWDGSVDAGAAAPNIIAAVRAELWPMLLVPQITAHDNATGRARRDVKPEALARLYLWGEQSYALEQLVVHQPARWLPSGIADWNTLLAIAVDRALTTEQAPADLTGWTYGRTHPVEINHPVLSISPMIRRLLGVTTGSGPRAVSGDTSTIRATSHSSGPSERFTADLADPQATTSNLPTGQSGNPLSPWYLDQLPLWLNGSTLPLPLHGVTAAHTLTLTP